MNKIELKISAEVFNRVQNKVYNAINQLEYAGVSDSDIRILMPEYFHRMWASYLQMATLHQTNGSNKIDLLAGVKVDYGYENKIVIYPISTFYLNRLDNSVIKIDID